MRPGTLTPPTALSLLALLAALATLGALLANIDPSTLAILANAAIVYALVVIGDW